MKKAMPELGPIKWDPNIGKAELSVMKLDLDPLGRSFTGANSRQGPTMEYKDGDGQVKGCHYLVTLPPSTIPFPSLVTS